jgi:hypothetical protein
LLSGERHNNSKTVARIVNFATYRSKGRNNMGYTTNFRGIFALTRPLTDDEHRTLREFADERHEASDTPSLYCQWVPAAGGAGLAWDGNEKFYAYVEWLRYLIERFLTPWGIRVNGTVYWCGDDSHDSGVITVVDSVVAAKPLGLGGGEGAYE